MEEKKDEITLAKLEEAISSLMTKLPSSPRRIVIPVMREDYTKLLEHFKEQFTLVSDKHEQLAEIESYVFMGVCVDFEVYDSKQAFEFASVSVEREEIVTHYFPKFELTMPRKTRFSFMKDLLSINPIT